MIELAGQIVIVAVVVAFSLATAFAALFAFVGIWFIWREAGRDEKAARTRDTERINAILSAKK